MYPPLWIRVRWLTLSSVTGFQAAPVPLTSHFRMEECTLHGFAGIIPGAREK